MVGHLKCIAGLCIKYFEAKAGGLSEPPRTPCLRACAIYQENYTVHLTCVGFTHARPNYTKVSTSWPCTYVVGRKLFIPCGLGMRLHTHKCSHSSPPPPLKLSYRVPYRKHLTPLQASDPGGTITMVTASGRSFTQQINTENTAVQETNPATPGQLVF